MLESEGDGDEEDEEDEEEGMIPGTDRTGRTTGGGMG